MTPQRERAKQLFSDLGALVILNVTAPHLMGIQAANDSVIEIITHAIEDAVEEAGKAGEIVDLKMLRDNIIATEREANAKFADKCTKLMHCNVAAAIRNHK